MQEKVSLGCTRQNNVEANVRDDKMKLRSAVTEPVAVDFIHFCASFFARGANIKLRLRGVTGTPPCVNSILTPFKGGRRNPPPLMQENPILITRILWSVSFQFFVGKIAIKKHKHTNDWLVVWNMFYFSIYWECHHPNWRTHVFQRGGSTTNQNIIYSY